MNMEPIKMTQEEKLEKAKELYKTANAGQRYVLERLFPELKESEDERIRKELIEHIKDQQSSFISAPDCRDNYEEEENNKYNSWLSWLEKQGGKDEEILVLKDQIESLTAAIKALKEAHKIELEKQGEQNPAWSEEDEIFVHGLIRGLTAKRDIHGRTTFSSDCIGITETINWLKSLKKRVQS